MSAERRDEWLVVTEDAKTVPVIEILTGRGFVTGKSGSGKSVLEGTIVYTEDGRKPIEEVRKGEKVLSLNKHDYQQEYREVLATIEHESDRLLRITLEDGTELVGTEDHSFLTIEDLEIVPIRGDDLEEGTWLPLARTLPSVETVSRIDLAEYVEESRDLDINESTIRSGRKTNDRVLELDFDAGKVLGLYLAEGSFDSRLTVQIPNSDPDVKEFLGENGFKVYERTCNRAFQPFGKFLEAEFGRGSGSKEIPDWVFEAPDAFKRGLLSGYFDGDGSIDTDVTAMSKSPGLVPGLKELLRHFGISTTVREKFSVWDGEERRFQRLQVDAHSTKRLSEVLDLSIESKTEAMRTLVDQLDAGETFNSKDMIPGFGPVLNEAAREREWTKREIDHRSKAASAHVLTRKQKAGRRTFNRFIDELGVDGRAKRFGRSDVQWQRIVDIEALSERRTVYDLDVRLNDNFIANGVFVHNSNTAGVIAEELLSNGYNLLIVDTEGEYFGLKERFELLHVGGDEFADVEIGPSHAEKVADIAIRRNMPVILDVSGYDNVEEARTLVAAVLEHIYELEKQERKPFLLMVEEMQEYLPQQGSGGEVGELLERIAKRGRKRGLGLCGMSQRPSSVDKDFITQCDWMVWHRLTWETDINVVRSILGSERAAEIQEFEPGEGVLMTEWDDTVEAVKFRRKRTHDAGATPGLESYERPDLQTIGSELIREIEGEGGDPGQGQITEPAGEAESTERLAPADPVGDLVEEKSTEPEPSLPDDAEELREQLRTQRRRNEVLSAEVEELRSILEGVEGRDGAPTVRDEPDQPRIEPPTPPRRPANRDGVGGNLVEFGEMTVYLVKSAWYRVRVRYHHR